MKELFIRAMPGVLVEVDLNKIPDEVVKLAREILRGRHRAHPPPRVIRERYYRAAPYLSTY
ncbi:hypothetical protein HKL94_01455 [Candidatus Parcubacteria bacterium]|nr:hypothetical protein [Candidatus Parcubacteria bacterium]